jgi:hypothetical protein
VGLLLMYTPHSDTTRTTGQATLPSPLVSQLIGLLSYLRKLPGASGSVEHDLQRSYGETRGVAMAKSLDSVGNEMVSATKSGATLDDRRTLASFLDALIARAKVRICLLTLLCCLLSHTTPVNRPSMPSPAPSSRPAPLARSTGSFCPLRSLCSTKPAKPSTPSSSVPSSPPSASRFSASLISRLASRRTRTGSGQRRGGRRTSSESSSTPFGGAA